MQTNFRGRDFIGDLDFSKEEVETVLDVAWDLKRKRALGESHALLRDKTLAMLFFFTSTRTRGSFESGMAQLGGHAAFIDSETTQISHGDTAKEIGVPLQMSYVEAGGTDGGNIHLHKTGVPTVVLGVAARHIHSHSSIIHREDYDNAVKLLVALVQRLDAATVASFTD